MKKILLVIITAILMLLLAFSASALHIRDSAVTYEDVPVISDGEITEDEEKMTLGKVENLSVVKSERGSVTLSWDELENVYAYKVFIKYRGDENYRYVYTVRKNEVTIDNIENEDELRFRVRGYCYDTGRVVYGLMSDTVKAVTKPARVDKIYTRSITDDSVTLYWDKPSGATGYSVYVYRKEADDYELYKTTSRTTITVSGLEKDTAYNFKIKSHKEKSNSKAYGDMSDSYKEYTYNSGAIPHTKAQAAQNYNELIANLKAEKNMTVQYKKTIDTEYIGCDTDNLAMTVKNTLGLFEGTLKTNYTYKNGYNDKKSANKLIEPYSKKPSLTKDDIESYSVTEKENGYIIKIILKSESNIYSKGMSSQKSYFDGVLALPQYRSLKTTPLTIDGADSYYDGGTLSVTVKDGMVSSLNIQAAVLSDIDFSVADVKASAVVAYEMTESYKIKYNNETQ